MSNHRRASSPHTNYEQNARQNNTNEAPASHFERFQHHHHQPLGPGHVSASEAARLGANIHIVTTSGELMGILSTGHDGYSTGSPTNLPIIPRNPQHLQFRDILDPRENEQRRQIQPSSYQQIKIEPGSGGYPTSISIAPHNNSAAAIHSPRHPTPHHTQFTQAFANTHYHGEAEPELGASPAPGDGRISVNIPDTRSCIPPGHQGHGHFTSPHQQFSSPEQVFPPGQAGSETLIQRNAPLQHHHGGLGAVPHYHFGHSQLEVDEDPSVPQSYAAGPVPAGWFGPSGIQPPHAAGLAQDAAASASATGSALQPGPHHHQHFHAPHSEQTDLPFRHHQLPQNRTLSVSSDQSLPYMTDLQFLINPEQPDDGGQRHAAIPDVSRRSSQTSGGREDLSPPKKRSNTQVSDGGEMDDGSKKRIRGRPRVEPKDETPADRRRTQIRLAQRAYRNRKETALQTLEKKVQGLQDNNEEMSKAFMKLHDLAVEQGLLQTAPEFGRQLKATTEKFIALAKKLNEEGSRDDDSAGEQDNDGNNDESPGGGSFQQGRIASSSPDSSTMSSHRVRAQPQQQPQQQQPMMVFGSAALPGDSIEAMHQPRAVSAPFGYQVSPPVTSAHDFELGTQAAVDHGSFPPGTSLDSMDLGSVLAPSIVSAIANASMSPFSAVPSVPASYSYQERTFGRRLQRAALEQGLLLVQMSNPPPHIYAAVFGFCLLFEPRENIVRRLTNCIRSNHDETLHNWRYPFFHLGGAGTFFDAMTREHTDYSGISSGTSTTSPEGCNTPATSDGPIGNQGMKEPYKPFQSAGFGMGPFDAAVESARDLRVDSKMRIVVPGFEGNFFDPDEVEFYLRQRGVYIPPAADFVTAEVDTNDFSTETFDSALALSVSGSDGDPMAAMAASSAAFTATIDAAISDPLPTTSGTASAGLPQFSGPAATTADAFGLAPAITDTLLGVSPGPEATLPSPMMSDNLDLGLSGFMPPHNAFDPFPLQSTKQKVNINVAVLVDELVHRSVCLGRSPGIRPKDVNTAFWLAASAA